MNFETVIGLEVHVELNTNSKIFSPTSAHFGNDQNANTNVIDWSFPGVLPVLNKGVVDAGIKAALALNMDIHKKMHFDRKNYFYPDNPKAYQISQFDEPIGYNGWIEVELEDGTTKKIGIERAHLEEDAGKNTHGTDGYSYVDLNRQGVPLIEIVSEADMRSPEEAYAYLTALKEVIQYAGIKAALALNMDIHQHMHFDRKNYFYPDNPKAYQISQFDEPIGYNGWIEVELEDGTTKKIGIERAHLEEDAGKNTHGTDGYSYVDLNRQGVPLIEIVSEADMRSPEEAYAYLTALKEVIQYAGISDVKMEEGSMRVDANISLRPYGQEKFGTKTELKNLNSFSNVRKGLEYEVQRQAEILRSGGQIRQETRRYDEANKATILMRVKEGAADYRYFPEPDLPLFEISDEWIEEMRTELPEFPKERRARYVSDLGLSDYDASQLTANKVTSDFFEKAVALGGDAKQVSNWLQGEVAQFLNAEGKTLEQIELTPENLVEMIAIIEDGTISSKIAKKVFVHLAKNGGGAREYVEKAGLVQISDPDILIPIIHQVFADNEAAVADFKSGKRNADKAFTGFLMKATKGQANPQVALKLLAQELAKLKENE